MTSFKMAAKETVGKSKLCIVLPIHDRNSQYFFILYILEGMDSEYRKKIDEKPVEMCIKTMKYIFF